MNPAFLFVGGHPREVRDRSVRIQPSRCYWIAAFMRQIASDA
jgi:hypothetical protein